MVVNMTDRTPKPRVINVKQYASKTDRVVFTLDSVPFEGDATIVGEEYRQSVSCENGQIIWDIDGCFTQKSGTFDIQLEMSNDEKVWRSDVMLLIVSKSTEGEKPAPDNGDSGDSGNGEIVGGIVISGIIDAGIVGKVSTGTEE